MKRTQVYIEEDTIRELERLASRAKKTKSLLIRQFLKEGIQVAITQKPSNLMVRLAKMSIKTGDKNLSKNINSYLYARK